MSYTISKEFSFSAAHQLSSLPASHPCSRLHGHNYTVRVEIEAYHLDQTGFVIDYGELNVLRNMVDNRLDHRNLNDIFPFNPTAENLAAELYRWAMDGIIGKRLHETHGDGFNITVGVSETSKTWATYSEER